MPLPNAAEVDPDGVDLDFDRPRKLVRLLRRKRRRRGGAVSRVGAMTARFELVVGAALVPAVFARRAAQGEVD